MKMFPICPNPKCSPLAPMTRTILRRKYYVVKDEMRCPQCKRIYDITVKEDTHCHFCDLELVPVKAWFLQCPKCKNGQNSTDKEDGAA